MQAVGNNAGRGNGGGGDDGGEEWHDALAGCLAGFENYFWRKTIMGLA
jgi:hypothetical protein